MTIDCVEQGAAKVMLLGWVKLESTGKFYPLFRLFLAHPWTAKKYLSLLKEKGWVKVKSYSTQRKYFFQQDELLVIVLIAALNFSKVCFLEESSAEEQKSCGLPTVPTWIPWTNLWELFEKDIREEKPEDIAQLKLVVEAKAERIQVGAVHSAVENIRKE